jgi:3-methylfumaryl-CoA hydratase
MTTPGQSQRGPHVPAAESPPAAPEAEPVAAAVERTEMIIPGPAEALAGLLGVAGPDLAAGDGLPLLWHWLYLLDRPPQAVLGADGHRERGGIPTPPGPGRSRMFAGGSVTQHRPLRAEAAATSRTWVADSTEKQGRSGRLVFVAVRRAISQDGQVVISERQDIVYRDAGRPLAGPPGQTASPPAQTANPPAQTAGPPPAGPPPAGAPPAAPPPNGWQVEVGPTVLFRFSALTYNAHRIHYDRDYARSEGYPGLVVHGPLQAVLMAELARRQAQVPPAPGGWEFSYRLVAPLFEGQGLVVSAVAGDGAVDLAVHDASGRLTATAVLTALADSR